jgi:hypothetical protein
MAFVPSDQLSEMSHDIVGCGKINNHLLPRILTTASVYFLKLIDCILQVSHQFGQYVNLNGNFLCSFNTPYTLVHNVSNNIF